MKIGITYDLKDDYLALGYDKETCAEFDSIDTIDAIGCLRPFDALAYPWMNSRA